MPDSPILQKCCSIGERIGGDPSHFMIERALTGLGLDWRFLSFEVSAKRLDDALTGVDALGLRGVRLLGALRDQATAQLARTARSERTGRVTHLVRQEGRLQGDDTSGQAFLEVLAESTGLQGNPVGKQIVLLGSGGAASSIADSLLQQGVASIGIADFDANQAEALAQSIRSHGEQLALSEPPTVQPIAWDRGWLDLPEPIDWVVSTASWPKGKNSQVAELVGPEVVEGELVVDLGVGSSRSPLLLAAEQRGATTIDGLPMLVAETALALEAWSGKTIDRTALHDAAEEFLGL